MKMTNKTFEQVYGDGMGLKRKEPDPLVERERFDRGRGSTSPLGGVAAWPVMPKRPPPPPRPKIEWGNGWGG
jgi:hypothetical protein